MKIIIIIIIVIIVIIITIIIIIIIIIKVTIARQLFEDVLIAKWQAESTLTE